MTTNLFENFRTYGYAVAKSNALPTLNKLRQLVVDEILIQLNSTSDFFKSNSDFLDYFHTIPSVASLSDGEFNKLRRGIINAINAQTSVIDLVFEAFENELQGFLGPDIVVQKLVNLTIQKPNDEYPTEIHRDAPPNSPFELVVWLPLVDCFDSKCMHVVPLSKSLEISAHLSSYDTCSDFEQQVMSSKHHLDVPFGSALFFSPSLFHFSEKNIEPQTRFSLNLRFKNMFSPYGSKHPAQFFKPFRNSVISEVGYKFSNIL